MHVLFVLTTEREEMEQKEKRPAPSMYFSNHGSVLTRRIPGIEQVAALKLALSFFLPVSSSFVLYIRMLYS